MKVDHSMGVSASDPLRQLKGGRFTVSLAFWWLLFSDDEAAEQLLYAWVIPSRDAARNDWTSRKSNARSFDSGRRVIVRESILLEAAKASELIDLLFSGSSLEEACALLGLPSPGNGKSSKLSPETRSLLPPAYFGTSASQSLLPPTARSRTSPTNDAGCYCTRFVTTNKLEFLNGEDADALFKWVLEELDRETGVGFCSGAADALGSIEIFAFPSLDQRQKCRVEVDQIQTNPGVESLIVKLPVPEDGARYLVQMRVSELNDVIFDRVAEAINSPPTATFRVPDPFDGIVVRVWIRPTASDDWVLWHEQEQHYIREISINMNLMGLTGELRSDWLENLKGTKAHSRADGLKKIQQVSIAETSLTSTRVPWEKAALAARQAVARVFPTPSGAKFFDKGWEGDTKLSFAEWLKAELSNHGGNVVLADPYFDVPGLDLVSRASGAAKETVVLTCTQIASSDDDGGPNRAERLRTVAENVSPILRGIKLRLLDRRSVGGGSSQLFHDRYLLVYDASGRVTRGFNLSTSLQSATRTSPLLVTPIPPDTLDAVSDYVGKLLSEEQNITTIEVLYPPTSRQPGGGPEIFPESAARAVLKYASVLRGRPDYLECSNAAEQLGALGLSQDSSMTISWTEAEARGLGRAWADLEPEEARQIWSGLSESLARDRTRKLPELVQIMAELENPPLEQFLVGYLLALASGKASAVVPPAREETRTLAYVFELPFEKAIDVTAQFYDHHHQFPIANGWSTHFAAETLVDYYPGALDDAISALLKMGDRAHAMLSSLVSAVVSSVQAGERRGLDALVMARSPFLRALAVTAKWRLAQRGELEWHAFVMWLDVLPNVERQNVLARVIYDRRLEANRRRSRGEREDATLLSSAIGALIATFDGPTTIARVQELLPSLSGPLNGSWSRSTNDEIVVPLVRKGYLAPEAPLAIWEALIGQKFSGENSYFYSATDVELFSTWGVAYWLAPASERETVVASLRAGAAKAIRVVREPFLESRNYERWRKAADTLLLSSVRLAAILDASPRVELDPDFAALAEELADWIEAEELTQSAIGELKQVAGQALEIVRRRTPNAGTSSVA